MKLTLKAKLILICLALVITPIALLGVYSVVQFSSFGNQTSTEAYESMMTEAQGILLRGAADEAAMFKAFMDNLEKDVLMLASSSSVKDFVGSTVSDESELSNKIEDNVKADFRNLYDSANIDIDRRKHRLFSQLRYIDDRGNELVKLQDGSFDGNRGNRLNSIWFPNSILLRDGDIFNTGVVIGEETGEPELYLATPVYHNGMNKGVVVANVDWRVVWEMYKVRIYGETGYTYIMDNNGMLVSHPTYNFKDQVCLFDSKYGVLAELSKGDMLTGNTGFARYEFEGIDKFVAYHPLEIGGRRYVIAPNCPSVEFLSAAEGIRDNANESMASLIWVLVTISLILGVVGTVTGFVISNAITKPLDRAIDTLADGASQISSSSDQISTTSQTLAETTSEQAASLEEISSSIEELSSMTKRNAANAQEANNLAIEALKASEKGNSETGRMLDSMKRMNESAVQTKNIVKTIDEIAFQTNLLALNAAVEAARAGEAGKGFAVVAEEVRNLAQRASEAARTTAELIEESTVNTERSSEIAQAMAKSLEEISTGSSKVTNLVSEIAAASKEQSQGIEQVNTAISQIDQSTQANASGAEEAAAASEELNAQAQSLLDVVDDLVKLVKGQAQLNNNRDTPRSLQFQTNRVRSAVNSINRGSNGRTKSNNNLLTHKEVASSQYEEVFPLNSGTDDF